MKNKKGFALIELIIIIGVVIIGGFTISEIIEFNNSARKEARYSQAKLQLKRMYVALETFYGERGCYPRDVNRNISPPGLVPDYLETWLPPNVDSLKSIFDYEAWLDSYGNYWIGVIYLGENKDMRGTRDYYMQNSISGNIDEIGDDLFIQVAKKGNICH